MAARRKARVVGNAARRVGGPRLSASASLPTSHAFFYLSRSRAAIQPLCSAPAARRTAMISTYERHQEHAENTSDAPRTVRRTRDVKPGMCVVTGRRQRYALAANILM